MQVERYMNKISGPLLDRIDLHIEVPAVSYNELSAPATGTSSREMREQVQLARRVQADRFAGSSTRTNAQMSSRELRRHGGLDRHGSDLLRESVHHLGLSARAHDKVIRVARTIADLEGASTIRSEHVSEAINYRTLDRKLWS